MLMATYLLIGVGGLVRGMGAGMGCPDWPTCYGRWVPPQDESLLPDDYQVYYHARRKEKNLKLATWLTYFGLSEIAATIRKEAFIFKSVHFNPAKAWTEYINRLVGVGVGILACILCCCAAFGYVGTPAYPIFLWSLGAGICTLVAGLLGAVVVATHLLPFAVTIHMGIAFLIIVTLLIAYRRQRTQIHATHLLVGEKIRVYLKGLLLLLLVQLFLGTQLREAVDRVSPGYAGEENMLDTIGMPFYAHRSISWLLIVSQLAFCYLMYKKKAAKKLQRLSQGIAVTYICQVLLGIWFYYGRMSGIAQSLHLLLAFIAYGGMCYLIINTRTWAPQLRR